MRKIFHRLKDQSSETEMTEKCKKMEILNENLSSGYRGGRPSRGGGMRRGFGDRGMMDSDRHGGEEHESAHDSHDLSSAASLDRGWSIFNVKMNKFDQSIG